MARIAIIGDGPAGLSAALFLARADHDVVVYAQDDTAMHWAQLHNYLGIPDINGTHFQQIARGQALDAGATIAESEVAELLRAGADEDGFEVRTADGGGARADYLVIAAGKKGQRLTDALGIERSGEGVTIDTEYRTTVDRVYAVGRLARPNRSQAIISAGAGATAAVDILAREAGKDVTDWDEAPAAD